MDQPPVAGLSNDFQREVPENCRCAYGSYKHFLSTLFGRDISRVATSWFKLASGFTRMFRKLDLVVLVMLETNVSRLELGVAPIEDLRAIQSGDNVVTTNCDIVRVPLIRNRIDGDQPLNVALDALCCSLLVLVVDLQLIPARGSKDH
jgi:hypothetical protein